MSRRTHSSPGPLAAALLAAALPACSLLFASDLDDADAGAAETPEGGATDATDAAGDGDGGRDGGDGGDGAPPVTGCASYDPPPVFCEDFDDGPIGSGWDELREQSGTLTLDPLAYSPPQSGRANLIDAPSCSYTRFERVFSGVGTKRVEVHVQIRPSAPWTKSFTPLAVRLRACTVLIYFPSNNAGGIAGSSLNIQSGSPLTNDVRETSGGPRLEEWTDVRLAAVPRPDDDGADLTLSFHHGDGSIQQRTLQAPQCRVGGTLFVGAGYHCDNGASEIRYDDVRVYWE
ncbi:MAG: hypothetical protein KF850_40320 [Labilithrix sp.]|nr:hypothetical protein [Labilithrix sp.]